MRPAPDLNSEHSEWLNPAQRSPSMFDENELIFLNNRDLIDKKHKWSSGNNQLWLYNLHYFDDLNAEDAIKRQEWHRSLIKKWITENPPGLGIGWHPYPQSRRIVNWIKWCLGNGELNKEAKNSLACQVRFLTHQVEWHIRGNHLLANAKALVFAGVFFEGAESDTWLSKGMRILSKQIAEQILKDGGHFERSTMYHSIVFEDLLDLFNLYKMNKSAFKNYTDFSVNLQKTLEKMRFWLSTMCHPDGEISFFNDAAFGTSPSPSELFSYADRLGIQSTSHSSKIIHLKESGYIRINNGLASLIIDVAPIGPNYQPGHAHADTLSFELSLKRKRVIVNSGTSQYEIGPQRDWERSTAAHNTVEIDQQNSSEIWSSFRVANRAFVKDLSIEHKNAEITIKCSHDGYKRLPGKPIHTRMWSLGSQRLEIVDNIDGNFSSAVSRTYFHPDFNVKAGSNVNCGNIDNIELSWKAINTVSRVSSKSWHPEFGKTIKNYCLENTFVNGESNHMLEFNWVEK